MFLVLCLHLSVINTNQAKMRLFYHFIHADVFLIPVGKVGSKSKEDAPYELESQFVLRLPLVRLSIKTDHLSETLCD